MLCMIIPMSHAQQIIIKLSDGSQDCISLVPSSKINFTSSTFQVVSQDYDFVYELSQIRGYSFKEVAHSVVQAPIVEKDVDVRINIYNEEIHVNGTNSLEVIQIFGISGIMILEKVVKPEEDCVISLKDFAAGVYLIKTRTNSIKIVKK